MAYHTLGVRRCRRRRPLLAACTLEDRTMAGEMAMWGPQSFTDDCSLTCSAAATRPLALLSAACAAAKRSASSVFCARSVDSCASAWFTAGLV